MYRRSFKNQQQNHFSPYSITPPLKLPASLDSKESNSISFVEELDEEEEEIQEIIETKPPNKQDNETTTPLKEESYISSHKDVVIRRLKFDLNNTNEDDDEILLQNQQNTYSLNIALVIVVSVIGIGLSNEMKSFWLVFPTSVLGLILFLYYYYRHRIDNKLIQNIVLYLRSEWRKRQESSDEKKNQDILMISQQNSPNESRIIVKQQDEIEESILVNNSSHHSVQQQRYEESSVSSLFNTYGKQEPSSLYSSSHEEKIKISSSISSVDHSENNIMKEDEQHYHHHVSKEEKKQEIFYKLDNEEQNLSLLTTGVEIKIQHEEADLNNKNSLIEKEEVSVLMKTTSVQNEKHVEEYQHYLKKEEEETTFEIEKQDAIVVMEEIKLNVVTQVETIVDRVKDIQKDENELKEEAEKVNSDFYLDLSNKIEIVEEKADVVEKKLLEGEVNQHLADTSNVQLLVKTENIRYKFLLIVSLSIIFSFWAILSKSLFIGKDINELIGWSFVCILLFSISRF